MGSGVEKKVPVEKLEAFVTEMEEFLKKWPCPPPHAWDKGLLRDALFPKGEREAQIELFRWFLSELLPEASTKDVQGLKALAVTLGFCSEAQCKDQLNIEYPVWKTLKNSLEDHYSNSTESSSESSVSNTGSFCEAADQPQMNTLPFDVVQHIKAHPKPSESKLSAKADGNESDAEPVNDEAGKKKATSLELTELLNEMSSQFQSHMDSDLRPTFSWDGIFKTLHSSTSLLNDMLQSHFQLHEITSKVTEAV